MVLSAEEIDVVEAGAGPLVVLVHSSVAGARQWKKLMAKLATAFHVQAVNLYGYGRTPAWPNHRRQTLADLAGLVEAVIPREVREVRLVGHSLGASVAMKAASHLGDKVARLVLIEPNPFPLLVEHGRQEALAEVMRLRRAIKEHGAAGEWEAAAAVFADYWGGSGTWAGMDETRRTTFAQSLRPNFHEWDSVMEERNRLSDWVELLPRTTSVVADPATRLPIREIVALMRAHTPWRFEPIAEGGHMAPLTRPELVNPIIERLLGD